MSYRFRYLLGKFSALYVRETVYVNGSGNFIRTNKTGAKNAYCKSNGILIVASNMRLEHGHQAHGHINVSYDESPFAKAELKDWMHTGNKASRAVFEWLTGKTLPDSNKATFEFIDTYTA